MVELSGYLLSNPILLPRREFKVTCLLLSLFVLMGRR
jgi:hypothetical protein